MLTDHLSHGDGLVAHGFIRRLAERGHSLFVAAEQVSLRHLLPATVRVFPIRRRFKAGGLGRLEYMREVRRLYRDLQGRVEFDVIHQLNPVYTGITLALWPIRKPLVLGPYVANWPHDPDTMLSGRPMIRTLLQNAKRSVASAQQRNADALLLTTEETLSRVVDAEQQESMTFLLPHGIDSDIFNPPSSRIPRSEESIVILFLANISERKGIYDLLKAFDSVASRFPDVTLWIAGGGEHEESAKALACSLQCEEKIRFLGRQTREEALECYRKADIYCLPSHGEPFGMTVLEAMSCGLPVVVTNAGGVRWIVDDGGGIRVPVRDPDALAQALSELIVAPQRRKQMGVHNRAKILKQFTWDRVIDRLEEIYSIAMSRHARAGSTRIAASCDGRITTEVGVCD
jgi:glycosyltransferase involved in cell wall biosynthesis